MGFFMSIDTSLIKPGKTAVIVIDIQFDYCAKEGVLPKAFGLDTTPIDEMIDRLGPFLEEARNNGIAVVWTRMNETPRDMPANFRKKQESQVPVLNICTPGTPGFEYYRVHPAKGEKEVVKIQYDAFTNPELNAFLKSRGIENIIFTGVYTSRCVDSTLRSAAARGYNCIAAEDLVAVSGSKSHKIEQEGTLSVWRSIFAHVVKSQEIVKAWKVPTRLRA